MPYPRDHLYVTWGGSAWGGEEQWQCGLHFDRQDLPGAAAQDACVTALRAFHSAAGSSISVNALLEWAKFAVIGVDGRYPVGQNAALRDVVPGLPGGGTGTFYAPQVSLAVSLVTDLRRGVGARGRFYPPAVGINVGPTGRVSAPTVSGLRASAGTLLQALQTSIGEQLVIASPGSERTGAPGVLQPVTGSRVGNVLDTQRRRREQLLETYSEVTPLPPA